MTVEEARTVWVSGSSRVWSWIALAVLFLTPAAWAVWDGDAAAPGPAMWIAALMLCGAAACSVVALLQGMRRARAGHVLERADL